MFVLVENFHANIGQTDRCQCFWSHSLLSLNPATLFILASLLALSERGRLFRPMGDFTEAQSTIVIDFKSQRFHLLKQQKHSFYFKSIFFHFTSMTRMTVSSPASSKNTGGLQWSIAPEQIPYRLMQECDLSEPPRRPGQTGYLLKLSEEVSLEQRLLSLLLASEPRELLTAVRLDAHPSEALFTNTAENDVQWPGQDPSISIWTWSDKNMDCFVLGYFWIYGGTTL